MITGGIYVHIPFCESKCYYCNFYSKIASEDIKEKFVEELCKEILLTAGRNPDFRVKSIYFGGGTPSVLSEKQLEKTLGTIQEYFISESPEITLEVNPSSADSFSFYKQIGINRVSIGVQSLSDPILQKIGRRHTARQALDTLEKAQRSFDNISADLILGVDEKQDPIHDFDNLKPYIQHLSAYLLTVEEKTPLHYKLINGSVSIATEDTVIRQYNEMVSHCADNGFLQYETSNFCKLGFVSKHNSSYWDLTPYLGFGPGAHSYYNGIRYYNVPDVRSYLKGEHAGNNCARIERRASTYEDKREYVMLALRTRKGIDLTFYRDRFESDFFIDFGHKIKTVERYLKITDRYIFILPQFFLLQNSVIEPIIFE